MAHMDRTRMVDMYSVHVIRFQARALQTSFYLLGGRRDAMRQWLKKRRQTIGASVRAHEA